MGDAPEPLPDGIHERLLVSRDRDAHRYELRRQRLTGGRLDEEVLSRAHYSRAGAVVDVSYVETQPAHRGNGFAAMLMSGVLDDLRTRFLSIRPTCGYARSYMRERPDTLDLLADPVRPA
jgi:uncharacterized protein